MTANALGFIACQEIFKDAEAGIATVFACEIAKLAE
jgi:hypothetical protein